jgi:transcription antitermination factor NusG
MTDKKIEQLTNRLKQLNIEQEGVIRELEKLTNTSKPKTPDAEGSELLIGDKVRITNKGLFKEKRGTVTKIGKLVSITLDSGQTTTRKSTNLLKQNAGRNDYVRND